MNWDAIGAVGEIIGAAVIFVTLIYLAYQVRLARLHAADETRRGRVASIHQIQSLIVTNPQAMKAWSKASGPQWQAWIKSLSVRLNVSQEEAELVGTIGAGWAWTHWSQYRSSQSKQDLEELKNIVGVWYSSPPMSVLFDEQNFVAWFEPEFVSWIRNTVKELEAREDP